MDLSFFSSESGIAIAWICTVVGFLWAFLQKVKTTKLKNQFDTLNNTYNELKIENTSLEQKIIAIENNDIRDNYQEVKQTGKNNINQGVVKGDVSFEMS